MSIFKKKKPELKKLELIINRVTLRAEYHCPYCQAKLVEDNPRLIQKPKEIICKRY
jgi:hypothetical protein